MNPPVVAELLDHILALSYSGPRLNRQDNTIYNVCRYVSVRSWSRGGWFSSTWDIHVEASGGPTVPISSYTVGDILQNYANVHITAKKRENFISEMIYGCPWSEIYSKGSYTKNRGTFIYG